MTRHKQRHGLKPRSVYVWHRYMGVTAALFVLILAITGLLLNHTDRLRLADRHIANGLLLNWYGIGTPDVVSYATGEHWLSTVAGQVYLDADMLPPNDTALVGGVADGDMIIAAYADRLVMLDLNADIIEVLDALPMPQPLQSIGRAMSGGIIVRSAAGNFLADDALLNWQQVDDQAIAWSTPGMAPAALSAALQTSGRAALLDLERVLLDLHSGRLFGRYGLYIMDAAALIMIGLALSGVWLWYRQGRKRKQHAAHTHRDNTSDG